MIFKKSVYEHCRLAIAEKLQMHKERLAELIESTAEEGKDAAADPNDAGIAMLQQEQANVHTQISEIATMKTVMDAINPDNVTESISKGSLIKAGGNYYYLSVALGKMNVDGKVVFAISPQSPLGSKLIGHTNGDTIEVNGKTILIEQVS